MGDKIQKQLGKEDGISDVLQHRLASAAPFILAIAHGSFVSHLVAASSCDQLQNQSGTYTMKQFQSIGRGDGRNSR